MSKPSPVTIPTEPIGSIPRPVDLIERVAKSDGEDPNLAPLYEDAIRDTIERFEATLSGRYGRGTKEVSQFLHVLRAWAFEHSPRWFHNSVFRRSHAPHVAAHTRPSPVQAVRGYYPDVAMRYAHVPVKQAVISPSELSPIYPAESIRDYPRQQFIDDLLSERKTEIRRCPKKGCQ